MPKPPIAWGAKVSPAFRSYVREMSARLGIDPNHLMACMAFETGETFSPSIRNKLSGATGLIQFMPATASALGTSIEALAALSDVQQLVWVEKYFRPNKNRLKTLSDVYMAILWPGAIGKPEDYPLFKRYSDHPKRYIQNSGLDWNLDGVITKAEASDGPAKKLWRGLRPSNMA